VIRRNRPPSTLEVVVAFVIACASALTVLVVIGVTLAGGRPR
jgi:hypothetical protein